MKLQSRYEYDPKLDLLGTGGFARVYRARDTLLDRQVALKVYKGSGPNNYSVLSEIKRAIQLEHPNLLRYYDVVLLEKDDGLGETEQLQIGVMEYANGGDLKAYARAHPGSAMLIKLLKQVLLGLEYLHGKGIIHRDLKAANILLVLDDKGEPTAKISDFGISKDMGAGQQSSSMMVGTIEYMAPEQFSPAKYGIDGKVGTNVDLWAFGVMVHELLLDSTPFGGRDGDTTVEQIMASILSTEQPKDIDRLPEPYRSVVKRCLVANAKERIRKAAELIDCLEGAPPPKAQTATVDAETKVYPKAAKVEGDTPTETRVYDVPSPAPGHRQKPVDRPKDSSRWTIAGGSLAAILLVVAGGWWYIQWSQEQKLAQDERQRQALPAKQQAERDLKPEAKKKAEDERFKRSYQVLEDRSTIKDLRTGLTWSRCSLGENWSGEGCTGTAVLLHDDEIRKRIPSGWRVPTARELSGLILCTSGRTIEEVDLKDGRPPIGSWCAGDHERPTIDKIAFPSMAGGQYRTSSARTPNTRWFINFS